MTCPFCEIKSEQVIPGIIVVRDSYPLSEGHTLVIPSKHVESVFELSKIELSDIWTTVCNVRDLLDDIYKPDGFTIGVNDGQAAGQTIKHAHIHVIPRHFGDNPNHRGGIRWVIPDKAAYWEK